LLVLTEVTFAMDATSRAPSVVGSMLVPHAHRYAPRWVERGDRTYVIVTVTPAVAEGLIARLTRLHRSIRCIGQQDVVTEQAG
jgi:hypothetical protein